MARAFPRFVSAAFCLLGTVLVCSIFVGWPPQSRVPGIVHAQDNPAASTKIVITPAMDDFGPVFIGAVRYGTTKLRPTELTEDEIRAWFVPSGMTPRPAKPSRSAHRFQAGDDWLQNLSINAVNRTGKKIVLIEVGVRFPEINQAGGILPGISMRIPFGRIPSEFAFDVNGEPLRLSDEQPSLDLCSGYGKDLPFAAGEPDLRSMVERWQPFSSVSVCMISFQQVMFADGMRWSPGHYYSPDPDHRGRYLLMDRRYFPAAVKATAAAP